MSHDHESNYEAQEFLEEEEGKQISLALNRVIEGSGISKQELSVRTGIPPATISRMSARAAQEPKPSQIARLSRALEVPFEAVFDEAGWLSGFDIPMLLARDKSLHPTVRRHAVETYRLWQKLSEEERKR